MEQRSAMIFLGAGNDGEALVHGGAVGALFDAVSGASRLGQAALAGGDVDATFPAALGAMVGYLGHIRVPRGRACAPEIAE